MNEKKECKIIQDLLPNYIENLTNEETNKFIEEHLNKCNDCKKDYENMSKDSNINKEKSIKQEVNYIKKYRKKMKVLKTIILVILAILLFIFLRREFIIFSLDSKAKRYDNVNNYHSTSISYFGEGTISKSERYYKDGKFISIIYVEDCKLIEYCDGNSVKSMSIDKDGNITENNIDELTKKGIVENYTRNYERLGLFSNLFMGIEFEVYSGRTNGKECYILRNEEFEWFKDKETGRTLRKITYQEATEAEKESGKFPSDIITDSYYEEGVVTDEIIEQKYFEALKSNK